MWPTPRPVSCSRSSGGVSMRMRFPASVSTSAPTRVRRSRGSVERHTAQPHPICGTPKLVPVPRNVSFIRSRSDRLDLEEVSRTGHVEWNARGNDYAIAWTRETSLHNRLPRSLHHLVVGVAMRNENRNYAPHECELAICARL